MAKHKHITEPDKQGYQVRVVREYKEHSRYFSHKLWGSKNKSLNAAINWRDQLLASVGKSQRVIGVKQEPTCHNKTTGVRGVSRAISYDKRSDNHYLIYQVYWTYDGKIRNKKFQAGNVKDITGNDEFHAFRTAVLFRKEFEECSLEKKHFNHERYINWKNKRLYERIIPETKQKNTVESQLNFSSNSSFEVPFTKKQEGSLGYQQFSLKPKKVHI